MNSSQSPFLFAPSSLGGIFFVTLRLQDALPEHFMQSLGLQYYTQQVKLAPQPERDNLLHLARKRLFTRFDDALDLCKYGHAYLTDPALAQILIDEIHKWHEFNNKQKLLAYTILPNHVHLLLQFNSKVEEAPTLEEFDCIQFAPLRNFVERLQEATAIAFKRELMHREAHIDPITFQKRDSNGAVKQEAQLWHERTFDFYVQNQTELEKITSYILQNAQKAELTKYWEDWPYTHW